MAVIKQGILGGLSGKIGSVVGSSWKGIAVLKTKPLSVANPNTPDQQYQRSAFKLTVEAAQALLAGLISPYWNKHAEKMSGFNLFMKKNVEAFKGCCTKTIDDFFVGTDFKHPAKTVAATGNATSNTVDFTWVDNTGEEGAQATDTGVFVVWNETTKKWYIFDSSIRRDATSHTMNDVESSIGDDLYCFLAFKNADDDIGGTEGDLSVSS